MVCPQQAGLSDELRNHCTVCQSEREVHKGKECAVCEHGETTRRLPIQCWCHGHCCRSQAGPATVCASCQCLQENQSNKGFHYKSTKTGQCNAYYANHTSHRYFAYPWRLTAFTPQFIQVGYIAVRNATLQRAQIRNLTCCTVTRTSVLKRMRPTSSWSKNAISYCPLADNTLQTPRLMLSSC